MTAERVACVARVSLASIVTTAPPARSICCAPPRDAGQGQAALGISADLYNTSPSFPRETEDGEPYNMQFNRCLRSLVVCAAGWHLCGGFLTPRAVQQVCEEVQRGRVGAGADGGGGGMP